MPMQKRKQETELAKKRKSISNCLHDLVLTKNIPALVTKARNIKTEQLSIENEQLREENERLKRNIESMLKSNNYDNKINNKENICNTDNENLGENDHFVQSKEKDYNLYDNLIQNGNVVDNKAICTIFSDLNNEISKKNEEIKRLKKDVLNNELVESNTWSTYNKELDSANYKLVSEILKEKNRHKTEIDRLKKHQANIVTEQNKTIEIYKNILREKDKLMMTEDGHIVEKDRIRDTKQSDEIKEMCLCENNIFKIENLLLEINDLKILYEERKQAALYHKRNSIKNTLNTQKREDTSIEELKTDIKNLRALLRCTACDKNFKNTVLLRCCHVFCKECVDEKIRTRNRKCMSCNENFLVAEVKKIFL